MGVIENLRTALKFNIFFSVMNLMAISILFLYQPYNKEIFITGLLIIISLLLILMIIVDTYVITVIRIHFEKYLNSKLLKRRYKNG